MVERDINFEKHLKENIETHLSLSKNVKEINRCAKLISNRIKRGGKLLICGNGGSAADAQHLSAEYLVRLKPEITRKPLPAISLAQDVSTLTACGNDFKFEDIFLRPFQALSNNKDILICISTSGNSKNILKVLKEAKKKKIATIGFLGNKGGKAKKFCDIRLIINSKITSRIQECHIFLGHFIFEKAKNLLLDFHKKKKN